MKIVHAGHMEFGYELLSVIPYAFYLHSINQLKQTISGKNTKDWYFFSKNHIEEEKDRAFDNISKVNIPNKWVHRPFNFSQWKFPNYKQNFLKDGKNLLPHLSNLVIISNKCNLEWGVEPCNYIDKHTLDKIFNYLTSKGYTIIYNRLTHSMKFDDGVDIINLGDFDLIEKKYPNVLTIQQLMSQYKIGFNSLQLRLYSLCDKFISVQGGTSIISSMFGGHNIVLFNKGNETHYTFHELYPRLSNVNISRIGVGTLGNHRVNVTKDAFYHSQAMLFDAVQSTY